MHYDIKNDHVYHNPNMMVVFVAILVFFNSCTIFIMKAQQSEKNKDRDKYGHP